jgi:hypothetical protein
MAPWQQWLRACAVRMLRVGAAAGVAVLAGQTIWSEVRWSVVLATVTLAMLIEFLVCVASLPEAPFPKDLFGPDYEEEP